ncbi:MAG: hypothetical protein IPN93_07755 [Bacteroidetes bacterium]|nr:hypothetical protein [Bacteroidota bacterium]MBK8672871.1 hypothetical protein [Bacteroidota bacterium]MBL0080806.1 hypothetical protein [Bacteroidota bacterium]
MKKYTLILILFITMLGGCVINKKLNKLESGKTFIFKKEMDKFEWYNDYLKHDFIQIDYPNENKPNKYLFEIGGRLLRDNALSFNHKFSCTSCHNPNYNFADTSLYAYKNANSNKNLNLNTPSLTNLGYQKYFGNEGKYTNLENYILMHISDKNIMNIKEEELLERLNSNKNYLDLLAESGLSKEYNKDIVSNALGQYIRSLSSIFSSIELELRNKNMIDKSDREIIAYFGYKYTPKVISTIALCTKCHSSIAYGGVVVTNNGTTINGDQIKVPGIKNIAFSAPYMHDGRFKTLEEVIEYYNKGIVYNKNLDPLLLDSIGNPIRLQLSKEEVKQLSNFLKDLTDTEYLNFHKN